MLGKVTCRWYGDGALDAPVVRYALLDRLARVGARSGVDVLAFGLGDDALRIVVDGDPDAVRKACRGVRAGTARAVRARGAGLWWRPLELAPVPERELVDAVAWAHRAPREAHAVGPLGSPWSSHRDLLGFRRAPFYDRGPLSRRVDARSVHRRAGGRRLPVARPRPASAPEPIGLLLRVAAGVRGVLPADRRCFRLFVHLARARGWSNADAADALVLTRRRVRQLASAPEPLLDVAVRALADPRLRRVP